MFAPFGYAFVQRGVLEVLLLSAGAGVLGTWAVMRGLAFYSHAVAAAAFPGLVLAAGLGFAPLLGAMGTGAVFAAGVGRLSARRRERYDALTALALVGALAVGMVLASNVFHSGADVDTLLFGSLFSSGRRTWRSGSACRWPRSPHSFVLGPRWLATGFDPGAARALGVRSPGPDLVLLGLVALAAVAALAAVGALLATALIIVPAVTARLWTQRLAAWQLATTGLAAAEGVVGVWLSFESTPRPGPRSPRSAAWCSPFPPSHVDKTESQ